MLWRIYKWGPDFSAKAFRRDMPPLPEVGSIFEEVAAKGDAALIRLSAAWDGVDLSEGLRVAVPPKEKIPLPKSLSAAIKSAYQHLFRFHTVQWPHGFECETAPGVRCGIRYVPLERVGLYVPGGTAPLFSTVLMLGVPARVVGVPQPILMTPPQRDGSIHPAVLYAAALCGITEVYRVGGAQAIAAMALGTESIAPVDKIFGPGNRYVQAAKLEAARRGIPIDMPAGPSEVVVLADETTPPSWIAWDLLAQAEHGPDSLVGLITPSESIIDKVSQEIQHKLLSHPRRHFIESTLQHSWALLVPDLDTGIEVANAVAPEHLILAVRTPGFFLERVRNAGSVFLGRLTPESAGDYASGTNHVLPTGGFARSYGSLTVQAFLRSFTYQELLPEGVRYLTPIVTAMAQAEGLLAHAEAMRVRYAALS